LSRIRTARIALADLPAPARAPRPPQGELTRATARPNLFAGVAACERHPPRHPPLRLGSSDPGAHAMAGSRASYETLGAEAHSRAPLHKDGSGSVASVSDYEADAEYRAWQARARRCRPRAAAARATRRRRSRARRPAAPLPRRRPRTRARSPTSPPSSPPRAAAASLSS
jgi:hypothetical protein